MAEPIKINTGKYKKDGKVDIDGNVWSIKLPGAGTELKLSQAQRRLKALDKKIESGTATEADLDKYDVLEKVMYDSFKDMLNDGTDGNEAVHKWIHETPTAIISQVFEDIKEQANGREESPRSTE